jgi:FAD/FMN-containing dehydrogenase
MRRSTSAFRWRRWIVCHGGSGDARRALSDQHHLFFGHIGDGNLHVLSGSYEAPEELHRVEEVVYGAVAEMGGCISAEHGIGVIKKEFLSPEPNRCGA